MLPEDFNEWENLQDLVRLEHNKVVMQYFKNQENNDISTPKARLKHTCLIKDEDTVGMTQMRMWLFEVTCAHLQAVQRPVYGIPVQEFQSDRKFKPQIKLYFLEKYNPEIHDFEQSQTEGEITFRLMKQTSETISRADAERLALKIKNLFANPIFTWNKGYFKCTYSDRERGYDLRLLVTNKSEGERIIKHVLEIQDHPFDRNYIQYIDNDRTYTTTPGTHRVYGKQRKQYVRRKATHVTFRYAQLFIWGMPNPVNLVVTASSRLKNTIHLI
jgi:hypothetical protein